MSEDMGMAWRMGGQRGSAACTMALSTPHRVVVRIARPGSAAGTLHRRAPGMSCAAHRKAVRRARGRAWSTPHRVFVRIARQGSGAGTGCRTVGRERLRASPQTPWRVASTVLRMAVRGRKPDTEWHYGLEWAPPSGWIVRIFPLATSQCHPGTKPSLLGITCETDCFWVKRPHFQKISPGKWVVCVYI